MTKEDLKIKLTELFPSAILDESSEWLILNINTADFLTAATLLRNDKVLQFDYLFCQTCVDWKTHLTMVYHLSATTHRQRLVVKVQLDSTLPEIETVSTIWQTAEFNEREIFEMFGVNFINHPDLRLLILPDGWENKKPMLKNFEDPINMIKL